MKTSLRGFAFFLLALAFLVPTARAQEDSLEVTYLDQKAAEVLLQRMTGVREVTTVDYDLGIVVTTLEKDGQVLGIVEIMPLSEYLAEARQMGIRKALKETAQKSTSERQQELEGGLIPTFEFPIDLPKPIAGVIGHGGKIDVKGSQGIQFGGSKHFELEQQQTELTRQSPFPELKMKQHLIVNLEGTVGEKVHVFVDHDSERETETKNKIKLRYEGDEDEIVQEIEAGDTQLSLPGTRLIGGPPTHTGLFGIKGKAKVGPLNITAIASKEQGKAEELTISGGAIAETLKIDDIRFLRWRFFIIPADTFIKEGMIKVFVDDGNGANDEGTVYGEAYIHPGPPPDSTEFHSGRFHVKQVDEEYYTFDYQNNIIELSRGLVQNQEVLAVSYVTVRDETVGTFKDIYVPDDTVMIQLIKAKIPSPDAWTWNYELKHVYSLGATYVRPPVDLRIRKYSYSAEEDPSTEGGKTYLEILGLDKSPNDGAVDVDRIRWEEGLLIFPNDRPFQDDTLAEPDSIYDRTTFTDYSPKYYIEAVAKGTRTTFSLNRINILEGSVEVKLNGRELEQGQDYTIDYDLGVVTLLTPEASRPDANVTINYQYAPFLSLASKSLVGTRATYQFSDNAEIGTSWMYRSVATKELKPKLGEESSRILVGEVDGHIDAEPHIFTRLANALPLVSTEAKSSFSLSGEAAVSMPNPNTQGEVFIDDMEAVRTSYSLGVTRPSWLFGSVPGGKDTTSFGSPFWYNPGDGIPASYLYPKLPEARRNDRVTVLMFGNKHGTVGESTWVSLNRGLSIQGLDFSRSRALEVWVKGNTGRLHIDVGTNIPEDAPRRNVDQEIKGYNGVLDTEDSETMDGVLGWNEDTGLDGVQAKDSEGKPTDDRNDDYDYTPGSNNYSRVNGTEWNQRLDTEDLNGNYVLDTGEDYFEFTFDLASEDFVVNRGEDGWRLFRLALDDSMNVESFGDPDWENIISARIWMDGFTQKDSVEIAGLDIVGNKWRNGGVSGLLPDQGGTFEPEERVEINVKNNERDRDYSPPFDPGTDPYGNQRREQSLVIEFHDVNTMHRGMAYQLISQAQDYSDYKEMRLYVRGDTSNPTFFIKFGGDERNYYEYRQVVSKQWHEFVLPLKEFTDRKLDHKDDQFYFDAGGVGYGFYGKPSFRNIRRIELGIINQQANRLSGEIWIDEIRLSDPRRDMGTSGEIRLITKFADLMNFNIAVNRRDSEFRGLASERGTGATRTTLRGSGNMNLDKFFPEKWGLSIPINASINRDVSLPKYEQSSDIILSGEEARKRASNSYRRGGSINVSKTRQSLNKLLRWTIDKVRVGASFSENYSDSETRIDSSTTYNTSASYSYSPHVNPLHIFGLFDLSYFPSQFSFSGSYNKAWSTGYAKSDTQNVRTNVDEDRAATGKATVSYDPLEFVSSDYSIDVTRDLNLPGTLFGYDFGAETRRTQTAGVNYHFPLWTEYFSQSITYDTRYVENHDPDIGGLENDYRNVSNSNSANLSLMINISRFMSIFSGLTDAKDEDLKVLTPKWLLAKFLELSSRINSPNGSYTRSRNSQYSYLKGRPSWQYQFGFSDDVEDVPKEYYVYDQTSVNNAYHAKSGLSMGDLNVSISYRGSDGERGYSGNRTSTKSTTWPDMSVTLRSFERFVPIRTLMQSSDLRSAFSITKGESGPINMPPTTRTKAMNFTPLVSWNTAWKKRINTELSTDYSVSEKESGTPLTTNTETRKGVSLKVSTSFSAPTGMVLPLFGRRLKFKSNLDLSLTGSYSSAHSELVTQGSDRPPRINADTESFSISPRASYNFSKSVTGGLTMDFRQNRDKYRGRTGRDINVEFDVLFKF